jgi:hypothetical protein
VAALGKALGEVARATSQVGGNAALTPLERAQAYSAFQQATFEALSWAEMASAVQASMPLSWRALLAGVSAVAPNAWFAGSSEGAKAAIRASGPVARLLLAAQLAEQFDHAHTVRDLVMDLRVIAARLLSTLAGVRLVGGENPRRAAEHAVIVLGEMFSVLPVVKDQVVSRGITGVGRYEEARDAAAYHLREFVRFARAALNRWSWRRRPRERWWQIGRPKLAKLRLAEMDARSLIELAARAHSD